MSVSISTWLHTISWYSGLPISPLFSPSSSKVSCIPLIPLSELPFLSLQQNALYPMMGAVWQEHPLADLSRSQFYSCCADQTDFTAQPLLSKPQQTPPCNTWAGPLPREPGIVWHRKLYVLKSSEQQQVTEHILRCAPTLCWYQ